MAKSVSLKNVSKPGHRYNIRCTVRIPAPLYRDLGELAEDTTTTFNFVVNYLLEAACKEEIAKLRARQAQAAAEKAFLKGRRLGEGRRPKAVL